jgi:hypothetical protein
MHGVQASLSRYVAEMQSRINLRAYRQQALDGF